MRSPITLLSLATLASAVSLIDFKPRYSDMPTSDCKTVYTQSISGCQGSDFGSDGCSASCYKALQSVTDDVKKACANTKGIPSNNILVAYLHGTGASALCPKVQPESSSSAPSSTAKSSAAASSSVAEKTSSVAATQSASVTSSVSSAAATSSAASSSGALIVDTSSTPTGTAPASATASSKPYGGSGGGSPFDVSQGTSAAPGLSASLALLGTGLAATFFL